MSSRGATLVPVYVRGSPQVWTRTGPSRARQAQSPGAYGLEADRAMDPWRYSPVRRDDLPRHSQRSITSGSSPLVGCGPVASCSHAGRTPTLDRLNGSQPGFTRPRSERCGATPRRFGASLNHPSQPPPGRLHGQPKQQHPRKEGAMSDARWSDPREYGERDRDDEPPRVYEDRDRDDHDPRDGSDARPRPAARRGTRTGGRSWSRLRAERRGQSYAGRRRRLPCRARARPRHRPGDARTPTR